MNTVKRYFLFVLLILILLSLAGCWSNREIEDLSISIGLALDVGEESEVDQELGSEGANYPKQNLITSTLQIVPALKGKNEQQLGSSKTPTMFMNTQLTGDSVFQLYRQYSLRRHRPFIGHHLKVIVISSELASKYNLDKLLKFILRDNAIRPSCLVFISTGKATNTLNASVAGDIPAMHLRNMVRNQFRNNKILPPMTLTNLDGLMNSESSFILQNVISAKGEIEFAGAGIIKGRKNSWVGTLTEQEVEGVKWLTDKVKGGVIKTYDKSGQILAYEILSANTKIKSRVKGDDISFHVSIKSDGRLIENWNMSKDPTDTEYLKEVEQYVEEELKDNISKVIRKMQETYRVDVVEFHKKLRIQHPRVWKKVKENWDETFSKSEITYDVNLNITDYGSSAK